MIPVYQYDPLLHTSILRSETDRRGVERRREEWRRRAGARDYERCARPAAGCSRTLTFASAATRAAFRQSKDYE